MALNSLIHFSDATLIGLHALADLATKPGKLVQTTELARTIGASEHHLAKVMQRLVHAGLAHSVKGPAGGFDLKKKPDELYFKDIIEALDGPINSQFCPFQSDKCLAANCIFGKEISVQAAQLMEYLSSRTIADISTKEQ